MSALALIERVESLRRSEPAQALDALESGFTAAVRRAAVAGERAIGQVEAVPEIAFVVQQPRERRAVTRALEQLAAALRGAARLGIAAEVHERVHETDRAAAFFTGVARLGVPLRGARVARGRFARARQRAEHVRARAVHASAARHPRVGTPSSAARAFGAGLADVRDDAAARGIPSLAARRASG